MVPPSREEFLKIPAELRALDQWIVWRAKRSEKNNKVDKEPAKAVTGGTCAVNKPENWCDFDTALQAVEEDRSLGGVGFCFCASDPFCGVDLDDAMVDGTIKPEALVLLDRFRSYTEISQSGRGLHIIIRAALPGGGRKRDGKEIYDRDRFFAMTGRRLEAFPATVEDRHAEAVELWRTLGADIDGGEWKTHDVSKLDLRETLDIPSDQLTMLLDSDGQFRQLWNRRAKHRDQSPSGYDLAIAAHGALAGWTDQQIVTAWVAWRRKHHEDQKLRPDYVKRTLWRARRGREVEAAIASVSEAVAPRPDGDGLAGDFREEVLAAAARVLGVEKVLSWHQQGADSAHWSIKVLTKGGAEIEVPIGPSASCDKPQRWRDQFRELVDVAIEIPSSKVWQAFVAGLDRIKDKIQVDDSVGDSLETRLLQYLDSTPSIDFTSEDDRQLLRSGAPIVHKERYLLSLDHLSRWLVDLYHDRMSRPELIHRLRALGLVSEQVFLPRSAGKPRRLRRWMVPSEIKCPGEVD